MRGHTVDNNAGTQNENKKTALRTVLSVTAGVIYTEITTEFLFGFFNLSQIAMVLIDSFILGAVLLAMLYVLVFRPLNQKVSEANKAREETMLVVSELNQILNTTASAMRVIDSDFNVLRANPAFLALAGIKLEEAVGKKCYETFAGPVCQTCDCTLTKIIKGGSRVEYEICKRRSDGTEIPCIVVATPFKRPDGKVIGIVEDFQDMTRQKKAEEAIKYQASHDPLTGLVNRMYFNEQLSGTIIDMYRSRQKLCVMYLDLDKFKSINDTMGHSNGDKLLIEVAKRLTVCVRKQDTVARLGGDEFTLLLPQISGREDAVKVAGKIANRLSEPIYVDSDEININASIGIAIYPDDGEDAETLIKHADSAMYKAKETGRIFELYSPKPTLKIYSV